MLVSPCRSVGRHLGGNAFLLGPQLHLLAVLRLELGAFLLGLQATELCTVLVALLDGHQVAAVDAVTGALRLPGRGTGAVLLMDLRAVLFTFAGVLLFLLLNIEIADSFTEPGERFIAFRFAGFHAAFSP